MGTIRLVTSILVGIVSILAGSELYVNAQNMTNVASDGNDTRGNTTTSNTQTNSSLGDEKKGGIANVPKCLGSALCPD